MVTIQTESSYSFGLNFSIDTFIKYLENNHWVKLGTFNSNCYIYVYKNYNILVPFQQVYDESKYTYYYMLYKAVQTLCKVYDSMYEDIVKQINLVKSND